MTWIENREAPRVVKSDHTIRFADSLTYGLAEMNDVQIYKETKKCDLRFVSSLLFQKPLKERSFEIVATLDLPPVEAGRPILTA